MTKPLLLLFVRQPELGKVKTRLAKTMGPEKALHVYQNLLQHTHTVVKDLAVTKWVCYADAIPQESDLWSKSGGFEPKLQPAFEDLGARMAHFFSLGLVEGYGPIIIIGSDCPGLTPDILQEAFHALETHDLVLGPAQDGGYYLLGLRFLVPELFLNKPWSTANVLAETLADAKRLGLSVALLPELSDIDEEADLQAWPHLLH
ncbi:TIGR04282 family arsenosugar biosynthesis glycosyltransferase [Rufibacter sp. LB8]|uniref:TIGR04282 family arsenosugar biosynthesis glycosyltransferase n=1 Tax=Rufibacter sp. LB8 TaxID=2777781 RepID=UPI00178C631E|nr:TIGR04282 family arsenosugar biosynthesis glycosyltransferase [Rufibacter sp. LB8]